MKMIDKFGFMIYFWIFYLLRKIYSCFMLFIRFLKYSLDMYGYNYFCH